MNRAKCQRGGFTLIEVALAVLALGLGILVVFSLVPSSLRLASEDRGDTRCGEFVEVAMQGMRANASMIQNWKAWTNQADFATNVLANAVPWGSLAASGTNQFPVGGGWVRYTLTLRNPDGAASHSARLQVSDGQYGPPLNANNSIVAYTEFLYQGD